MDNIFLINTIDFEIAFWILLAVFLFWIFLFSIKWSQLSKFMSNLKKKVIITQQNETDDVIAVFQAIEFLKKINKGGTIIFEKNDNINDFISNPVTLKADLSWELIATIFEGSKSPLHDGAIVIKNHKIKYASAYINFLSSNDQLPTSLGTRHRSGIGITEKTDAVVIILSEETSDITISRKGVYKVIPISKFEEEMIKYLKL